jgi:hypothetical protein
MRATTTGAATKQSSTCQVKNSRPSKRRSPSPAQQQVLSWIHDVIIPALVENFIRTITSQQDAAGE